MVKNESKKQEANGKRRRTVVEAERGTTFRMRPEELVIIGRATVTNDGLYDTTDGPRHPNYQERALRAYDEAAVQGIMRYGVIKTVIGQKREDGRVEVVDGRGNVIDAREANRRLREAKLPEKLVEVAIKKYKPSDVGAIRMITNTHRTEMDLLSLAEDAAKELSAGHSYESVALFCHRTGPDSEKWVKDLVSILDCIPEVKSLIKTGAIPFTVAVRFAKLTPEQQKEALERTREAMANREQFPPAAPERAIAASTDRRGTGITRHALQAIQETKQGTPRNTTPRASNNGPKYTRPKPTVARKLAKAPIEIRAECNFSPDAWEMARWFAGEVKASKVPGLTAMLRKLGIEVEE